MKVRAQSHLRNAKTSEKQPNVPKVRMAFRSPSKKIMFGENYAPEYLKEQAKIELEYSKMKSFDRSMPLHRQSKTQLH